MISFQLTSKMALLVHASQLLLLTLLSWNVYCFPAEKGGSLYDPNVGSSNSPPFLHYSSLNNAPAQPSNVNHPAGSFKYEPQPVMEIGPQTYPASSTRDVHKVASWDAAHVEYAPTHTMSQPLSYLTGFEHGNSEEQSYPPPPPQSSYQAGELDNYEANFQHGSLEQETEALSYPPPPPPFPETFYQGGELSHYEAVIEHGNRERETEGQRYMQAPPSASAHAVAEQFSAPSTSKEAPQQQGSQALGAFRQDQFYLFLTGQLPPGTVSHSQSSYEAGQDHWDEVHYEKYHFPSAPYQTETQQVPNDQVFQKALDPGKTS
ncbi:uncharacterized protein [Labrus bergylta]|uniref:uncharacterized protein n=1 Tax=Labrus bergylta TaxID=56723 RepID=UPI0009B3F02B|nr:uncharacterized protein LOC109990810 [Labrus bergylta]